MIPEDAGFFIFTTGINAFIMSITVEQLVKVYGTQKAVSNLSFSVKAGEIVGFLGPNGAGKSTTMKVITGSLRPDGGKVHVCGIDVQLNPTATKRRIGYLPESNPQYFDMYVKEYLSFVAGVHGIANRKQRISDIIGLTGLTLEYRKKIGQLSKGYKQRVGLAAALVHDPEVLILDEPTSGLDPNQIAEIRQVIRQQGSKKTVLFSTHILQEVQAICDRVVIINRGKLVADQSLSQLTAGRQNDEVVLVLKEKVERSLFAGLAEPLQRNETTWVFSAPDPDGLKRKLMELAIARQLNIVSLYSDRGANLEEIFHELTAGGQ